MATEIEYTVAVRGCDDSTIVHLPLTPEEVVTLEKVAALINETSTYVCMPRMQVYKKEGES